MLKMPAAGCKLAGRAHASPASALALSLQAGRRSLQCLGRAPQWKQQRGKLFVCMHACRRGKASSYTPLLHVLLAAHRTQLSHGYLPGSGLPAELICPVHHALGQVDANNSMLWEVLSQHEQLRPYSHHAKESLIAESAGSMSDAQFMLPGKITWPTCWHNDAACRQSVLLECCQRMLCPWLETGDQVPER